MVEGTEWKKRDCGMLENSLKSVTSAPDLPSWLDSSADH